MRSKSEHEMDPEEVRTLLDELRRRLLVAGIGAKIHVVGGSAMALNFPNDRDTRLTQDIDAIVFPPVEVARVVRSMADDLGLSPTWLNSNAASFAPPRDPQPESPDGVEITVAESDELIAMKLAASREQDLHDLGILARHAGITDPQQLVDIAFAAYGEGSVTLNETRDDYLIMAKEALARAKAKARRH